MRRRTKLLILSLSLTIVAVVPGPTAVAFLFFAEGSTASSPSVPSTSRQAWIPLRPKPPSAAQLRAFLRSNGDHPTTCKAHGSKMVCLLAHGAGRCEEDAGGNGSCTFRGTKTSGRDLFWVTSTATDTITITRSG